MAKHKEYKNIPLIDIKDNTRMMNIYYKGIVEELNKKRIKDNYEKRDAGSTSEEGNGTTWLPLIIVECKSSENPEERIQDIMPLVIEVVTEELGLKYSQFKLNDSIKIENVAGSILGGLGVELKSCWDIKVTTEPVKDKNIFGVEKKGKFFVYASIIKRQEFRICNENSYKVIGFTPKVGADWSTYLSSTDYDRLYKLFKVCVKQSGEEKLRYLFKYWCFIDTFSRHTASLAYDRKKEEELSDKYRALNVSCVLKMLDLPAESLKEFIWKNVEDEEYHLGVNKFYLEVYCHLIGVGTEENIKELVKRVTSGDTPEEVKQRAGILLGILTQKGIDSKEEAYFVKEVYPVIKEAVDPSNTYFLEESRDSFRRLAVRVDRLYYQKAIVYSVAFSRTVWYDSLSDMYADLAEKFDNISKGGR
ncbi:hypothetical protein QLX41_gp164 [Listeria phage LMTA-94]|uniref:Uncharacterized protein n=1 Tax=Listeria phage LMTA-94 TaxID=1486419 RepID=A0A068CBJ0_9CAUD|nr:hypothetical protein QLX41_gp164 [Listeria phage LMTA-94]AID17234.1 hypothetical protein [Listeria phage LMTA-94]